MWRVFSVQSDALKSTTSDVKTISYMNIVSGIMNWRRFLQLQDSSLRDAFFAPEDVSRARRKPSKPLEWLLSVFADQELYKKFHAALQHAETSHTGKDSNDFVLVRTRQIREESEHRTNLVRALAASTLLLVLRRLLQPESSIPWPAEGHPGSLASVYEGVASLLRTSKPTMEPMWVKPTPPALTLYAAEILHLLHHAGTANLPLPFQLRDDAAQGINALTAPACTPCLPLTLKEDACDALATEFVTTLIDLNLTLPPDPRAKHAPTTLSDAGDDDICLGMESGSAAGKTGDSSGRAGAAKSGSKTNALVPREVQRLLSQSLDCLRWNSALALYILGLDLAVVCRDGLQRSVARWTRRGEQAKVLVTYDLLNRAERKRKESS